MRTNLPVCKSETPSDEESRMLRHSGFCLYILIIQSVLRAVPHRAAVGDAGNPHLQIQQRFLLPFHLAQKQCHCRGNDDHRISQYPKKVSGAIGKSAGKDCPFQFNGVDKGQCVSYFLKGTAY